MGAEVNILSNLFLPLGKVRMGYPSGEARWGLKTISCSSLFLPLGKVRMGYSLNHPDNYQMVFARTKMRKYL